jgi:hypothetical protein
MGSAVLAGMAATILLPDRLRIGPPWLLPVIEGVLLALLIIGDPGRIDRSSRILRVLTMVLVGVLLIEALWATGLLIQALVVGLPKTNDADFVLAAGSLVWFSNNVAFALLYWELDSGGSAARAHGVSPYPDLGFPQQLNPELAPPGWRPWFIDYLYLGFTNALAFSPTDVMPLVSWAKITMGIQSLLSVTILGLVVARAVNAFS